MQGFSGRGEGGRGKGGRRGERLHEDVGLDSREGAESRPLRRAAAQEGLKTLDTDKGPRQQGDTTAVLCITPARETRRSFPRDLSLTTGTEASITCSHEGATVRVSVCQTPTLLPGPSQRLPRGFSLTRLRPAGSLTSASAFRGHRATRRPRTCR